MPPKARNFLSSAKYYLTTLIWSGIALWIICWFIYFRLFAEKAVTDLPSKTHPYLTLASHLCILLILVAVLILPGLIRVWGATATSFKPKREWPRMRVAFTIIKNLAYYPFLVLYFRFIEKLPNLYNFIQRIWEKYLITLKSKHREFELIINIGPMSILCCALFVDIFCYQQIRLFYSALACIILPAAWYGFLMISEYILRNTLQSVHNINAIFLNIPKIQTLALWELRVIDPDSCIMYPPLHQPEDMPDKQFSEMVAARDKSTPALLNALFMIEILKRQSTEDQYFQPYYVFLRYMYMYLWTIVVVRSLLILL